MTFARYYHILGPQSEVTGWIILRNGLSIAEVAQKKSPVFLTDDPDVHEPDTPLSNGLPNRLRIGSRPASPQANVKKNPTPTNVNPPRPDKKRPLYWWMGTVRNVWTKHYPEAPLPKGAPAHLKVLMEGDPPMLTEQQLGERLDAYLTKVGPEYINLSKFASTHTAYAPRGVARTQQVVDLDAYETAMRGGGE